MIVKGAESQTGLPNSKATHPLIQDEKSFIEESLSFDAPAPALLNKSLYENLNSSNSSLSVALLHG
jgi:hypothetical protein